MATEPNALSILAGVATGGNSLLSVAPLGTTAPGDASATPTALPTGWLDAGWCDETGFTEKITESQNEIYAFGTTSPVRTVIKQGKTEFDLTLLETNAVTLALFNRKAFSAVTVSGATGAVSIDVGAPALPQFQALLDVVDGNNYVRYYLPLVAVTGRGNPQIANGEAIKYPITLTAYPNSSNVAVHKSYILDALKSS